MPTPRAVAADDLLRFVFVGDPQISPDGASVLFQRKHVAKNKYASGLWIVPADGGEPRCFTSGDKDRHGRFSPDGSSVAFIAERDDETQQVYTLSTAGGEAAKLTSFPEGSIADFAFSPDGKLLAVKFRETEAEWTKAAKKAREETGESLPARVIDDMYYRLDGDGYFNAQRHHLYLVDVASGEHRLLFGKDVLGFFSYDFSPDSSELIVAANTDRKGLLKFWNWNLYRIDVKSRKTTRLDLPEGVKTVVRASPDGKRLAYAGREGRDHWGVLNTHLYVCKLDGSGLKNLTGDTDYCLSAITLSDAAEASFEETFCWHPDGKSLIAQFGWKAETAIAAIDPAAGGVRLLTKGRRTVGMGNISTDGGRLALTEMTATTLPEVAVGELKAGSRTSLNVRRVSNFNRPVLAQANAVDPEPVWIDSTDGVKVHAWVLKPPGFKPSRKCPAILYVHGGPHCQYGEAFFHEFQVLAAAGYVVVYSNPRGSKGYGEDHCAIITGDWGHKDWQDVQSVLKFMQGQKFIDNRRIGIAGGSYGGFMANWAIGHTDEFAAAITDRCVSNFVSMVGSSDFALVPDEYWKGNSWDDTETLWNQSPLQYLGNANTPTLVIHSEGDLRCNVEQGEQVFAALKLRGVKTRFVRYPHTTSHGMSRCGPPDLRIHRLGQILDWFGKHMR